MSVFLSKAEREWWIAENWPRIRREGRMYYAVKRGFGTALLVAVIEAIFVWWDGWTQWWEVPAAFALMFSAMTIAFLFQWRIRDKYYAEHCMNCADAGPST